MLVHRHSGVSRSQEQVSAADERCHLSISDAAGQHPESTIRVDPFDAVCTENRYGLLDPLCHSVGALDFVVLYVDYPYPQLYFLA